LGKSIQKTGIVDVEAKAKAEAEAEIEVEVEVAPQISQIIL
jgi:ribosomal protein L9